MVQALSPVCKVYFDNLYLTTAAKAENHPKIVELQMREPETKEQSIQLQESMLSETEEQKEEEKDVESNNTEHKYNIDLQTNSLQKMSCWL